MASGGSRSVQRRDRRLRGSRRLGRRSRRHPARAPGAGTESAHGTGGAAGRIPHVAHRRGIPWHRPSHGRRLRAGSWSHRGRRPERLGQVEPGRGLRDPPDRPEPALGRTQDEDLAGRVAEPAPPRPRPDRGGAGGRRRRREDQGQPLVARRRGSGRRRRLGSGGQPPARGARHPRLEGGAGDLPAFPLLQRARFHARGRAVRPLRRLVARPRSRPADQRRGGAVEGQARPRQGPQVGHRHLQGSPHTPRRHEGRRSGPPGDGRPGVEALGPRCGRGSVGGSLSLFLPRATLSDSPFRFLVFDDPVQAMDPAASTGWPESWK